MSGETNLNVLLRTMKPELRPGTYVFCTLPPGRSFPEGVTPVQYFREKEGTALIAPFEQAEAA